MAGVRATGAHAQCDLCIAADREAVLEDPAQLRSLTIQLGYFVQALADELAFIHSYAMFDHDRARLRAHTVHLEQIAAHLRRRLPPGLGPESLDMHYAIDEAEPCPA
jgi:hypothetical protein